MIDLTEGVFAFSVGDEVEGGDSLVNEGDGGDFIGGGVVGGERRSFGVECDEFLAIASEALHEVDGINSGMILIEVESDEADLGVKGEVVGKKAFGS